MQWAEHRDFLEDQQAGDWVKTEAPALETEPELPEDLSGIYEAFWELHLSRQVGFSMSYIPLTEIVAYMQLFPVADKELFVACVRELDRVYISTKLSEDARRSNNASNPSRHGARPA